MPNEIANVRIRRETLDKLHRVKRLLSYTKDQDLDVDDVVSTALDLLAKELSKSSSGKHSE